MTDKLNDKSGVAVQGHIKIFDPSSGEIYVDKRNAIHYENMSIALAESLANAEDCLETLKRNFDINPSKTDLMG